MTGKAIVLLAVLAVCVPPLTAGEAKKQAPEVKVSSADVDNADAGGAAVASLVKGFRAITLQVPGHQLLNLKTGDRVDVLVTFEAKTGKGKEFVTATIMQDLAVLHLKRPEKLDDTGAVQLLCNPTEAQYAALSAAQAKLITLTVRSPGDKEMSSMEMASFHKLFK